MGDIIFILIIRMLWLGLSGAKDNYNKRIQASESLWYSIFLFIDWMCFLCSKLAVGILGFILTMFAIDAVVSFFSNHNDDEGDD